MSNYLGDFALGQTVRDSFSTVAAAGGRVNPSNAWETSDIRVYKNNGTTQRASEAGYTITSTFDTMDGATFWSIDTSDNTDAGFFVAGADYSVWLYPDETVDSQNVAACIGSFSIENRFPFMSSLPALSVGAIPLLGILDRGQLASVTSGSVFALRSAAAFGDDTLIGNTLFVQGNTQNYYQAAAISDNALTGDSVTVDPALTVTPSGGTYPYVIFAGPRASITNLPQVDATKIGGQTASASGTVTFPNATLASTTNITAGTITTVTNLTNAPTAGDLTAAMKASVNAEVVDVLRTDTVAELSAVPAANAPLSAKIGWLFMKARNAITQTATTQAVKADDGTTNVATATVSDDGTTATRGEFS